MRIEELTAGQDITLMVTAGDQKLEFLSTILECLPRKHMILAAPVIINGKILALQGKGLVVHMFIALPDDKPQIFRNITIQPVKKFDNSLCYTISTLEESKALNRRGAFRCYIGLDTQVQFGPTKSTIDAIIKDVSATGFAFTTGSEKEFERGETVHAVLNDHLDEIDKNYSFTLFGIIVRHYSLENGNVVYGCRFLNHIQGLENYIMLKERLRLQKSRGSYPEGKPDNSVTQL